MQICRRCKCTRWSLSLSLSLRLTDSLSEKGTQASGNAHNEDRNRRCFSCYRLQASSSSSPFWGLCCGKFYLENCIFDIAAACEFLSLSLSLRCCFCCLKSIKDVTFVYVIRFFQQIGFSIKFGHKLEEVFFHFSCLCFQLKPRWFTLIYLF